jgi:COG0454: histone acetyltransferase HPA2 and related acetyltransferases
MTRRRMSIVGNRAGRSVYVGWLVQFDLSGEFCSSSPLEGNGRFVSVSDAVVVRRATVFDVGALVALRAEMFRVTGTAMTDGRWRSNAHRWFTERVKNPIYGIFVVQAGQDVVACAMGAVRDAAPSPEVPDGRDVLVSNVCTFPAHRGHGYGKRAFEAVMRWAVSTGIGRAELMATEAGRGMYEQTGFVTNRFAAMRADLRTY